MKDKQDVLQGQQSKSLKISQTLSVVVFLGIIAAGLLLNLFLESPDFIQSERRRPASRPEFDLITFASGDFASEFLDYSSDNFVFRERLRNIRALTTFYILRQSDRNGLYFNRRSGIGRFELMDEEQYRQSGENLRNLLPILTSSGQDLELYFAIIPDKSFYTNRRNMTICPFRGSEILSELLPEVNFIDITDSLTIDDFYRTDLHWNQVKLDNVVKTLGGEMGFVSPVQTDNITVGEFFGVYYGQLALPMQPDIMEVRQLPNESFESQRTTIAARYMNDSLSAAQMSAVYETGAIYDYSAFQGVDPYSIFLRGPQSVVWLDTGNTTGRNLYVFRDSFASSIAPILAMSESYEQIVLIDMRYIDSRVLHHFVEFTDGSDVLFLYNTHILNNSTMFR